MSSNGEMTEMDFDELKPAERRVRYGGHLYILREASEEACRQYANASARCARMEDGKVVGVDNVGDVQMILVANCLCKTEKDGQLRLLPNGLPDTVTINFIRAMPHRSVRAMFDWVKEHSELDDNATEETLQKIIRNAAKRLKELREKRSTAKNLPSAGTVTSD